MGVSPGGRLNRALLAGIAVFALSWGVARAQSDTVRTPEQPLAQSLTDIARQTGKNILFTPSGVAGIKAHPLSGRMTAQEAVNALIAGTNLEAVADGNGGLIVRSKSAAPPALQPTQIQTSPVESVEEVTVTARRRVERVGNIPIAETVVTAEDLSERGLINDTGAIIAGVPGVNFENQGSSRIDDISIRGSSTGSANADGAVGLYRDGVYVGVGWQFDRNFAYIDTFDLQQVEVLRGPQGGLYGRNSEGGVVLAETAKPQFENSGHVNFDYGINTQTPDLQGVFNAQLSDRVAIRLSAETLEDFGGYYQDVADNHYIESGQGLIGRAQLRYAEGPVDVNFMIEHQTVHGFGGNDQLVYPAGAAGYPKGYTAPIFTDDYQTFPVQITDINDLIVTANYKLNFATLTSITGARVRRDEDLTDTDQLGVAQLAMLHGETPPEASTITPASIYNVVVNDSYNATFDESLYLAGNKVSGFTWLTGVEFLNDVADEFQDQRSTPTGATTPNNGSIATYHYLFQSYSPYADVTYDVLSNLSIEGNIRYEYDHKELTAFKFTELAPTPALYENPTLDENFTSYNVALTYRIAPDVTLYAKTSTGYRAGGFNPPSLSANPKNDPVPVQLAYADESIVSYEAGAKGNPLSWYNPSFKWLTADVALYRNVLDHLLTQISNGCAASNICAAPADLFLTNGGHGDQWGLEVSANLRFPLFGGDTSIRLSGSDQSGEFTSGHTSTVSLVGVAIPQEPRWIAGANLNYVHPFVYSTNIFFNTHYSGQWGGLNDVSTFLALPDHQVLDIRTGVNSHGWEAAFYCKNCGNSIYIQYIANANNYRWSEPRVYGGELRYKW